MSIAHENVKARYQQIKQKNEQKLDETKAKIFKAVPQLAKVEDALLQANLDILASGLNKTLDRKALLATRERLLTEKQTLLKKNGFAEDALEPTFDCDVCEDTGVTPSGARCACYTRYLLEERIKDSGLPENSGTFEAFNTDVFSTQKGSEKASQKEYMLALKKRCEAYAAEALAGPLKNLILMGNTGTGKSFLAQAVVGRMIKNGEVALYITANQLFSVFYNHRLGEPVDLEGYYDVPFLAIDDLGTEIMTKNVTVEYLYNLINEREVRGKATLVSTNLTPESFVARYGDRIYSRMFSAASVKYLIPAAYPDVRKQG